jgi:hypothetical protein
MFGHFHARSRAGLKVHPVVGHGALQRRWCEWEQPNKLSWRSAAADDAEWMFERSRDRLAPDLTGGSMDVGSKRARTTDSYPVLHRGCYSTAAYSWSANRASSVQARAKTGCTSPRGAAAVSDRTTRSSSWLARPASSGTTGRPSTADTRAPANVMTHGSFLMHFDLPSYTFSLGSRTKLNWLVPSTRRGRCVLPSSWWL